MSLDLGTLTVKLAADIDQLKKDFAKAQKETKRAADEAAKLSKRFAESFGHIQTVSTRLAGNFNLLGGSFAKVFGENGSKGARKIADDLGLSVTAVDGIAVGLKGLGGAFSAAAAGAQLLIGPFGAMLAMTLGIVAGWGAIKNAIGKSGVDGWKENFSAGSKYLFGGKRGRAELFAEFRPELAQEYLGLRDKIMGGGRITPQEHDRYVQLDKFLQGLNAQKAADESPYGIRQEFLDSLKSGAEDFKGIIEQVQQMFTPNKPKAADTSAARALADEAKARRDSLAQAFGGIEHELKIEAEDRAAALAVWKKGEQDWQLAHDESVKRMIARNQQAEQAARDAYAASFGGASNRIGQLSIAQSKAPQSSGLGSMAWEMGKDAVVGNSGYASSVAQGAAQGASVGGPWGAVIGAIIGLLTKSEGFFKVIDALDGVLGKLAEALGGIVGALAPIIKTAAQPIMVIIGVITQIASIFGALISALDSFLSMTFLFDMGLRPVVFALNALSAVLKLLESGLHWAAYGIKVAYNSILETMADVIGVFSDDAADRLRAAKADTQASRDAATAAWDAFKDAWSWQMFEMPTAAESVDLLSDSATDAARSLQRFSDGILNAAPGYKMGGAMFSAAADVGGPPVQQNVTININGSGDPERLWNQLQRAMERQNFLRGATTITRAPAFAGQ